MPRLPESVRSRLDTENSVTQSFSTSGVELRFRMGPEGADLLLHMPDFPEKLPLQIMHGSFQGYWDYSAKTLGTEPTRIHIAPLQNAEALHRVTQQEHLPFHPELVRVLLPYCPCIFDGVEGDVQPPQPGDEPEGCLMMVGSSITHGSLAMGSRQCYAHQLAHRLHMDWLNLGLAGACRL